MSPWKTQPAFACLKFLFCAHCFLGRWASVTGNMGPVWGGHGGEGRKQFLPGFQGLSPPCSDFLSTNGVLISSPFFPLFTECLGRKQFEDFPKAFPQTCVQEEVKSDPGGGGGWQPPTSVKSPPQSAGLVTFKGEGGCWGFHPSLSSGPKV